MTPTIRLQAIKNSVDIICVQVVTVGKIDFSNIHLCIISDHYNIFLSISYLGTFISKDVQSHRVISI